MAMSKTIIDVTTRRCIVSAMLCAGLHSAPAHAAWSYSLAAEVAMNDGLLATCGKIEPRLNAVLRDEAAELVRLNGNKAVRSARKSPEYADVYRLAFYELLKAGRGDPDQEAHTCERAYIALNRGKTKPDQWWRNRLCAGVPLNSVEGQGCGSGPRAEVSLENALADAQISILGLEPSSDVSFPGAGTFPQSSDASYRIVSINNTGHLWAIPESVEFEWKEWPSTFPEAPKNERELESVRSYVAEVGGKVQRKRAQVEVRGRIPPEVVADALQAEQADESGQSATPSLKLFFIFMHDGLRFRWEQWRGKCIAKYGGDEIALPRDKLLSGDLICDEPKPMRCDSESKVT
jgi:hypothetical protein